MKPSDRDSSSEILGDSKESSPFLDPYNDDQSFSDAPYTNHKSWRFSWLLHVVIFILGALASSGITVVILSQNSHQNCEHMKGRPLEDNYLPPDSPLLEIDRSLHTQWFQPWNFTPRVWNEHPSHRRVDKLWADKLGVHNHFWMIPLDKGADYNLDPRVHVVLQGVEGKYDGFPVNVEAIHQLHCLDALRRKLFMNREWYKENWEVFAQYGMEEAHTSHCLDMIRQVITCRADVGVLGWKWVKVKGNSLPDFHRPHQCHDFDAVRDWSAKHQFPKNIQKYIDNQDPPPDAIFADAELYH